jgi:hypothetical protein
MPRLLGELEDAYLTDHDRLTRGLELVARSLEARDLPTALAAAEALDQVAGPVIRFEEEEVYPLLRLRLGDEAVNRLYAEHEAGRMMLCDLLAIRDRRLEPGERERFRRAVRSILDHVLACGNLLTHLAGLERSQQHRLLRRLQAREREPSRWSERRSAHLGPEGRIT